MQLYWDLAFFKSSPKGGKADADIQGMKSKHQAEILINATLVTPYDYADIYEFVLNHELRVIECVRVESLADGIVFPVDNFRKTLQGVLFELNHVRVNPRLDNTEILDKLTDALEHIGVVVHQPPHQKDIQMCYKPLGEINENVRFYFNELGNCVFLCPKAKLKAVSTVNSVTPLKPHTKPKLR